MPKMRVPKGMSNQVPTVADLAGIPAAVPENILRMIAGEASHLGSTIPALRASGLELIKELRMLPSLSGYSPEVVSAATRAQSEMPTLMGHVVEVTPKTPEPFQTLGQMRNNGPWAAIDISEANPFHNKTGTFGHELEHVAQNLRIGPQFNKMYQWINNLLGYAGNPLEHEANAAGKAFASGAKLRQP